MEHQKKEKMPKSLETILGVFEIKPKPEDIEHNEKGIITAVCGYEVGRTPFPPYAVSSFGGHYVKYSMTDNNAVEFVGPVKVEYTGLLRKKLKTCKPNDYLKKKSS